MTDRPHLADQSTTPNLNPIHIGEVMGSDAFSEGDWVLLRFWDNKPTKVTSVQGSLVYVAQPGGEDFVDSLIHFYPDELGYPLDHRFWSEHQQHCYLRCHLDQHFRKRWASDASILFSQDKAQKLWFLGIALGLIALASKLLSPTGRDWLTPVLEWILQCHESSPLLLW